MPKPSSKKKLSRGVAKAGSVKPAKRAGSKSPSKKVKKLSKSVKKPSLWQRVRGRQRAFLKRRPHRSFRLTKRVDYKRSLEVEGYFQFSINVWREMRRGKKFFWRFGFFLVVVFLVFSLLMPQMSYNNLRDALNETAGETDFGGGLYRAGLLFLSSVSSSGLSSASDQTQQLVSGLMTIFAWLTVVYFLRHQLAGKPIKMRQALYSAGAPLVSTLTLIFIAVVQLIPVGLYAIVYSAAKNTELIKGGVGDMMAILIGVFLLALTLYWLVSTIIALVIVTISGTEPIRAWRVADDMVVGRRGRIVRRIVWHLFQVVTVWVLLALPIIWLENQLATNWVWLTKVPVVPFVLLVLMVVTVLWTSSYIYLLYRRILDDDAPPA